jgi:histidinol-phosphate aminotransferase
MDKASVELILNKFNGIVIIDEAYIDFADSESMIQLCNQYKNLIVLQTFSKAWGLAAIRVGMAYSCSEIISFFNKVKPPYNVSDLNQKAALEALSKTDIFRENKKSILSEKERLTKEISQMGIVKKIYPSDANFLLIRVDNADDIYQKLVAENIITRNRNKQVKNCLRVTIGTPEENNILIKALKNFK